MNVKLLIDNVTDRERFTHFIVFSNVVQMLVLAKCSAIEENLAHELFVQVANDRYNRRMHENYKQAVETSTWK
jgi:hypothetical protein